MWLIGIFFLAAVILFGAGCVIAARAAYKNRASLDPRQRVRLVIVFLGMMVFLAGFANFTVFFMVSGAIGGDAVAGKVEGGRYYVSSHGRLTEVTREVWEFSYAYAHITWATSIVAALGLMIALLCRTKKPSPLTITD